MKMRYNPIIDTDSYKASHWLQYPPGTEHAFFYLESRGGRYDETLFFGLQYLLKEFFSKPITMEDVEEAKAFMAAHGEPFNYEGFKYLVEEHGGMLPLEIRAVPEGSIIPISNALVTVRTTDPKAAWVGSWFETQLMRLWYPITVATQSFMIKRTILEALKMTSDDPEAEIGFKLHDFGSRGVSSRESAGIGGAAHLVNFMGSDTMHGIRVANHYYHHDMAAFSIPAAEHSTITSWGKDHEVDAYRNMLTQFGGPNKLVAVVSDSYDIDNACLNLWGKELKAEVESMGGTLVVRPDSGHPATIVLRCLENLSSRFGSTTNSKGYKVLPSCIRVLQGDGIEHESIKEILDTIIGAGFSASNIAFGMGGALLQKVDRDTQKFAFKCSSIMVNNVERDVFKDPVTDHGKRSKKGRLDLVHDENGYRTVKLETWEQKRSDSVMQTVFLNGKVLVDDTLEAIRGRAAEAL